MSVSSSVNVLVDLARVVADVCLIIIRMFSLGSSRSSLFLQIVVLLPERDPVRENGFVRGVLRKVAERWLGD